jgi:hypothetical protein
MRILSLNSPAAGFSGVFLLAAGVPVLVIFFGNIYCGYICPFGAAQELIGLLVPERFRQVLSAETMRKARFVKYAVLFVLVIIFFVSRNPETLASDPLISVFNLRFSAKDFRFMLFLIIAAALIGSVFYCRFWCRYLCPVGAFLSLFNKAAILTRYIPTKRFGRCEFGLIHKDSTDCLYCDKCRFEEHTGARVNEGKPARLFLAGVFALAILVSAISVSRFWEVRGAGSPPAAVSSPGSTGARNIDEQRIRRMIEQKRLSDKEAQFYRKAD